MVLVFASIEGDPLAAELCAGLRAANVEVLRVGLEPAAVGPKADAAHEAQLRAALMGIEPPLVVGGFSLGARIAASLCRETPVGGLLCFGYPFHKSRDPNDRHGLRVLAEVSVATRIVQGTRDNHGAEAAVRGYRLPSCVDVVWLRDGNHRFRPRERMGVTEEEHISAAVAAGAEFIRSVCAAEFDPD